MQTTDALYKRIFQEDHHAEYRVIIGGNTYGEDYIIDISTSVSFSGSSRVGNVTSRQLDLSMIQPTTPPPKMAEIILQYRLVSDVDGDTSSWYRKGRFFIDTRTVERSGIDDLEVLSIHAYDSLMKASLALYGSEGEYHSSDWPKYESEVVELIATKIGVEVDPRTLTILTTSPRYRINYPGWKSDSAESEDGVYSMHDLLAAIASIHMGNFIITEKDYLRLVPVFPSIEPDDTTELA